MHGGCYHTYAPHLPNSGLLPKLQGTRLGCSVPNSEPVGRHSPTRTGLLCILLHARSLQRTAGKFMRYPRGTRQLSMTRMVMICDTARSNYPGDSLSRHYGLTSVCVHMRMDVYL